MRKLLVTFITSMGLCGCNHSQPHSAAQTSSSSQILERGLSGEPSSLDPAGATDTFSIQIVGDLYEGLISESTSGDPAPGVAASWVLSTDKKQYTFYLRPNALWSNGKRVVAQDFVSAWRRVVDPKNGLPLSDDLRPIERAPEIIAGRVPVSELGVSAPNDDTLVVRLTKPAAYFLQILTHSSTYPIYSDISARSHNAQTFVSNGAYVLRTWLPGTSIKLKKSTSYWNQAKIFFPEVEYQIVPDENSQMARYQAGQLDLTDTVPASAIPGLAKAHPSELVVAPFLATAYYGLNLSAGPLSNNLKLRISLAMAIDRRRLVNTLAAGQLPAYGLLPPGIWNYTPQSFPWKDLSDSERVKEAQNIYRQAGYSTSNPLKLRVLYNSNPVIRQTALLISAMWRETLGVETELTEEEFKVFLDTRHDRSRWDVARLGWVADFNDAANFLDTLRSHSTNNDEGYSNIAFDSLLDTAANTEPEARRNELQNAEQIMLADYPLIPLYHFVSKRLVKPQIKGVKPTPLDRVPTSALSFNLE